MSDGVFESGSNFYQVNGEGSLKVTDRNEVANLNAEMLQGIHKTDILKQGTVDNVNYGISQNGKTLDMSGEEINLDTNSQIKIGNIVIKSSPNGNGILVGIES